MTRPFLITGCGRSGTAWAASLFTALGYPCGHEVLFSYDRSGPLTASESSWLAVPYLDTLPPYTPVLRVVRDPFRVVQSIMAKGFLLDMADPYAVFVGLYRPDIAAGRDHLARAIRYAALWDEPMDDREHWFLRIETSNMAHAAEYLTGERLPDEVVQDALVLLGTSINTPTEPRERPSVEQILEHPDNALLRRRLETAGYADGF